LKSEKTGTKNEKNRFYYILNPS